MWTDVSVCTMSACSRDAAPIDCLFPPSAVDDPPPGFPQAGGGAPTFASFHSIRLTIGDTPTASHTRIGRSQHARWHRSTENNVFLPSAICANGSVPMHRPLVAAPSADATDIRSTLGWEHTGDSTVPGSANGLSAAPPCAILAVSLEARARTHSERPVCPHGLTACSDYTIGAVSAAAAAAAAGSSQQTGWRRPEWSVVAAVGVLLVMLYLQQAGRPSSSRPPPQWSAAARRMRAAVARPATNLVAWASRWGEVIDSQLECPICLEPFTESRRFAMQPCQLHKVCKKCAAQWRAASVEAATETGGTATIACPVCRGSTPDLASLAA